MNSGSQPFTLDVAFRSPAMRMLWPWLKPGLERISGVTELGSLYRSLEHEPDVGEFIDGTLRGLDVGWDVSEQDRARIPRQGACIVVANHPFGAVEGLILASMLRRVRSDVKVLANYLLSRVEPLREVLLYVDPFGDSNAPRANLHAMRDAVRCLRDGGVLALFPAGEVAHFDVKSGGICESEWSENLARLVRLSGAPVLPVFFDGHNGASFHLAGLVHPRLRTALLLRELINKKRRTIDVRIGTPVAARKLEAFDENGDMVAYLRRRTMMLANRPDRLRRRRIDTLPISPARLWSPATQTSEAVADAVPPDLIAGELAKLPPSQCLVEERDRVVYWAHAAQIPMTLTEIGRLREITFREVQEGTGKALDLDAFDRTYVHLFAYDRRERAVVGAYRLGPTDELLAGGVRSLYTSTLFRMDEELFRQMGPALEMGRSFVCSRYQRTAAGLFLLFKGIGRYVADRPRYRILFGPVSISAAYAQASRELMVDFIEARDYVHPLAKHVRPRRAFVRKRRPSFDSGLPLGRFLQDIDDVSSVIADLEPDQKGVPFLFKQYLKLGGKMLGFNVDPEFSGVLDGLVLVDLTETQPKTLARYFGSEQADSFLAHHRSEPLPAKIAIRHSIVT